MQALMAANLNKSVDKTTKLCKLEDACQTR